MPRMYAAMERGYLDGCFFFAQLEGYWDDICRQHELVGPCRQLQLRHPPGCRRLVLGLSVFAFWRQPSLTGWALIGIET